MISHPCRVSIGGVIAEGFHLYRRRWSTLFTLALLLKGLLQAPILIAVKLLPLGGRPLLTAVMGFVAMLTARYPAALCKLYGALMEGSGATL